MKKSITTAALVLATLPAAAQSARTGVSNPDAAAITSNDDSVQTPPLPAASGRRPLTAAKPSAATQSPAATTGEVYGSYVPYKAPGAASTAQAAATAKPLDPDAEIVTSVPEGANELREGTLLHVRMLQDLSTATTTQGSKFSAEVMQPLEKDGRVIVPIGSILNGQVTEVRSGRSISGAAALHLEPRNVTLPDGTEYVLHAQLTDASISDFNVDDEGTLKRRNHAKKSLAVVSLATGGGAAAGMLVAGGVGALVGAGLGAGASTVMLLKSDHQATLQKDVRLVFSLTEPMELTPLHASTTGAVSMNGGAGPALKTAPIQ
ncbi:hypothetical protein [Edaphobacter bradus]|uniref:hypothetical protein n=1 Tax=Edaphobacter bradus TaxID=2259016 RepID=UPI0021E0853A|nr:hypothetical protein [Edaphobacter bradus]